MADKFSYFTWLDAFMIESLASRIVVRAMIKHCKAGSTVHFAAYTRNIFVPLEITGTGCREHDNSGFFEQIGKMCDE